MTLLVARGWTGDLSQGPSQHERFYSSCFKQAPAELKQINEPLPLPISQQNRIPENAILIVKDHLYNGLA